MAARQDKPDGGTVRSAFLMLASTGYDRFRLTDTDITLAGTAVEFDRTVASTIRSVNARADVTDIVKPVLDGAGPGLHALEVTEARSLLVDGTILAVVFDDPSTPIDRTVILAFGSGELNRDSLQIVRPSDVDPADVSATLSVGISFSFQNESPSRPQDSRIDVNATRLTSAAGGQDDGDVNNGSLITVGGIGDSTENPPDPFLRGCAGCDDELYDLTPFLTNDSTNDLLLRSQNPSEDDNLFFAGVVVTGAEATWSTSGPITCGGAPVTILGTSRSDVIRGTSGDDVIHGRNGRDVIDGGGGNDIICGGNGADTLIGGPGDDVIRGGNNDDTIASGSGNDAVFPGNGDDVVDAGPGDDKVRAGRGDDTIDGGTGNDNLRGGPGVDECVGGEIQRDCE